MANLKLFVKNFITLFKSKFYSRFLKENFAKIKSMYNAAAQNLFSCKIWQKKMKIQTKQNRSNENNSQSQSIIF